VNDEDVLHKCAELLARGLVAFRAMPLVEFLELKPRGISGSG